MGARFPPEDRGFALHGALEQTALLDMGDRRLTAVLRFAADGVWVSYDRAEYCIRPLAEGGGVTVDGTTFAVAQCPDTIGVFTDHTHLFSPVDLLALTPDTAHAGHIAPMPGRIVSLAVADGADVAAGDAILTLEAMKMQHVMRADRAGRVLLKVEEGAQVTADQPLFEIVE